MECCTVDFLRFFTKQRQNLAFGSMAGYPSSDPSISGIFLIFKILSRSATREATRTLSFW